MDLRTGDMDFDDCFRIEGSSHALACRLLHQEARRALFDFGPHGELTYAGGVVTHDWESAVIDGREITATLAIVRALTRTTGAPYRA